MDFGMDIEDYFDSLVVGFDNYDDEEEYDSECEIFNDN